MLCPYGRRFAAHFKRSPLELTVADVRAYLEHLRVREHKAARSINVYAVALAALFGETLGRRDEIGRIPRLRWADGRAARADAAGGCTSGCAATLRRL